MTGDLEPMSPSEAVDMYLESRLDDAAEKTIEAHDYRLRAFVSWCDEEGIANMNDLSGRDLYAYRVWRREGGYSDEELKTVTLRGDMATLRAFLRFCGEIEAVPGEMYDRVPLPVVDGDGDVSDSTLEPGRATEIVDWLGKHEYAQRRHVIMLVLWHTGCRVGELVSLDLGDVDLDGSRPRGKGPAVHFVHRPDQGTSLKNRDDGERWNGISGYAAEVLRDYIDGPRIDGTDDQGREPLVTTENGRIATTTVRSNLYTITRPCWRNEPCPHDEDPDDCEFTYHKKRSKCPSSRSPHDVRSGRATMHGLDDDEESLVSDRMDADEDLLEKHYDRRSERQRAAQRRKYFDL